MFQDRRRHLRNTVLLKAFAVTDRERMDVVCTNIGPRGGFFTSRRQPAIGEHLTIELRPGGMGSAVVELLGITARTTPSGGSWPSGFAVLWSSARCGLGAAPLQRILTELLRLDGVQLSDIVTTELSASFDVDAWLRGVRVPTSEAADVSRRPSSTAMRRVQGNWSPPMIGATAASTQLPTASRDDKPPDRVDGRTSSTMLRTTAGHRAPSAALTSGVAAAAPRTGMTASGGHVAAPSARVGLAQSHLSAQVPVDSDPLGFDALLDSDKTPAGGPPSGMPFDVEAPELTVPHAPVQIDLPPLVPQHPHMAPTDDSQSQSWPVWALAPSERRTATRSGFAIGGTGVREDTGLTPLRTLGSRPLPPQVSGARMVPTQADVVVAHMPGAASKAHDPKPLSGSYHVGRPASDIVSASAAGIAATPLPGTAVRGATTDKTAVRRPTAADPRALRVTDVPVTFMRKNQFVPGRVVAVAHAAVAIITEDTPPVMDEPLVINVPILVEGIYRTVCLDGKLVQLPQDTEHGKRFVMHIERIEEGKCKGAFRDFVDSLAID